VLTLINSDERWVRITTLIVSALAGAVIWEVVGWQFNPSVMVPLIGHDGFGGFVPRVYEYLFNVPLLAEGEEHGGALPRLYIYLFDDEEFRDAFLGSAKLFGTGFALGVGAAIPLGILMARLALVRVALESYILILYVTPMVALIPFILSMGGFGFWPKVLVVFLFTFFPVLYNTLEGARSVKPEFLEVARAFRTSELAIWYDVLIPYTLPFALTGIRQATGRALVGMIAAELLLATAGLGEQIEVASRNFDMAGVLALLIVITVFGVLMMRGAQALERRYAAWRGVG
jgi:ABC-type nitrate/sulfonate/bicarbonate transport system permease component